MARSFLLIAGLIIFAYGSYMPIKAQLSQLLIRHAWHESTYSGEYVKPWSWADTYPVLRLQAPSQEEDLVVLAGDTGNVLAFGPGLSRLTPHTNHSTTWLISAHRDTHFEFLQHLKVGDFLMTTNLDMTIQKFQVNDINIIDVTKQDISLDDHHATLKLITCYPFDALVAGGPLRYVVTAEKYQTFLY